MNPFLIRMLQKARRNAPSSPGTLPPGMGRVYAVALAVIVLLIIAAGVIEFARIHGAR